MDKKTLREIEDIITDMEAEARRNCKSALASKDHGTYMYWRGKRSALTDISIKVDLLMRNN